ncbi:hypothetical protein Y1Q_0008842 [Alligator mississippiensis]|uniref:Uncharacterized protein n=1 Tax=Alligator mississippiensis TaxID=8496 RepID=A0A151NB46_ALLMI|nr:hypothetical protein Y1Q_0008842 [Alligator mississippiensis]
MRRPPGRQSHPRTGVAMRLPRVSLATARCSSASHGGSAPGPRQVGPRGCGRWQAAPRDFCLGSLRGSPVKRACDSAALIVSSREAEEPGVGSTC